MRSEARISQKEKLSVNLRHIQCELFVINTLKKHFVLQSMSSFEEMIR